MLRVEIEKAVVGCLTGELVPFESSLSDGLSNSCPNCSPIETTETFYLAPEQLGQLFDIGSYLVRLACSDVVPDD